MKELENIILHREILDCRDKHLENIERHLKNEIEVLFKEIDSEIDKMTLKSGSKGSSKDRNAQKKIIQNLYKNWVEQKSNSLLTQAQFDLDKIYEHKSHNQNYQLIIAEQNSSSVDNQSSRIPKGSFHPRDAKSLLKRMTKSLDLFFLLIFWTVKDLAWKKNKKEIIKKIRYETFARSAHIAS